MFIYSLIMTLVLYSAMIFVERTILKPEDYVDVYIAKVMVERNTLVTTENINELFSLEERRGDSIPSVRKSEAANPELVTISFFS